MRGICGGVREIRNIGDHAYFNSHYPIVSPSGLGYPSRLPNNKTPSTRLASSRLRFLVPVFKPMNDCSNRLLNEPQFQFFSIANARKLAEKILSILLVGVCFFSLLNQPALAQKSKLKTSIGGFGGNQEPLFGGEGEKVTLTASFKMLPNSQMGIVSVNAEIRPQHHLYSSTQPAGGPIRTEISVDESDQFQVFGKFEPDQPPHVIPVGDDANPFQVPVEQHEFNVVWSAPIKISAGLDPKELKVNLVLNGQVCNDGGNCDPLDDIKVTAAFAGFDQAIKVAEPVGAATESNTEVKPFVAEKTHVEFTGRIVRKDGIKAIISPGDKVVLEISAKPIKNFHIYAYELLPTGTARSTIFAFTNDNLWPRTGPTASEKPDQNKEMEYKAHHKPVSWSFEFTVPSDAQKKNYTLVGLIGFQSCTDTNCDPPAAVKFEIVIPVGGATPPFPVKFESSGEYNDVEAAIKTSIGNQTGEKESSAHSRKSDSPEEIAKMAALYDADSKINYLTKSELKANSLETAPTELVRDKKTTLSSAIGLIFLGGILLNLMPCVFPVLGLKVMGFVEQAGSDPKKIRLHGIAFTLGLVVSMWALAGIVLTLKLAFGRNVSWGAEQMGNPYFVGSIIVLLFLMGLNMAGVFEIGTSLTRVGGGVQSKKGYTSSFLSGVLTTLIATPCSGPFLSAAMTFTLSQTPPIAMFLFTVFALGIAFPYLALAFFPALINKLPRPGAWMHTFKVTMAFALFATVAFFMQSFGVQTGVEGLSWLVMALVVLGLAAFFYGTWSPAYVKPNKRFWFGWVMPALIAGLGLWMTYDATRYVNASSKVYNAGGLAWQEWNPGKIEYMLNKKPSIVWVDYTASW